MHDDPMLSVRRGGNGRGYPSPEMLSPRTGSDGSPSQTWRFDFAWKVGTVLVAMIASLVVSWFAQQYQVKANTSDIARLQNSVTKLEEVKERKGIDDAAFAAELRAEMRAIKGTLESLDKRLERIETRP